MKSREFGHRVGAAVRMLGAAGALSAIGLGLYAGHEVTGRNGAAVDAQIAANNNVSAFREAQGRQLTDDALLVGELATGVMVISGGWMTRRARRNNETPSVTARLTLAAGIAGTAALSTYFAQENVAQVTTIVQQAPDRATAAAAGGELSEAQMLRVGTEIANATAFIAGIGAAVYNINFPDGPPEISTPAVPVPAAHP